MGIVWDLPPICWDCHCQRFALEFMSLCSSQDGGADVSAWGTEELWRTLQSSTGGLSDHPCPHGSAGELEGGGARSGQTAVGLQWKTNFQCGPRTEASRAAAFQGEELTDGSDNRADAHANWAKSDDECAGPVSRCLNSGRECGHLYLSLFFCTILPALKWLN